MRLWQMKHSVRVLGVTFITDKSYGAVLKLKFLFPIKQRSWLLPETSTATKR